MTGHDFHDTVHAPDAVSETPGRDAALDTAGHQRRFPAACWLPVLGGVVIGFALGVLTPLDLPFPTPTRAQPPIVEPPGTRIAAALERVDTHLALLRRARADLKERAQHAAVLMRVLQADGGESDLRSLEGTRADRVQLLEKLQAYERRIERLQDARLKLENARDAKRTRGPDIGADIDVVRLAEEALAGEGDLSDILAPPAGLPLAPLIRPAPASEETR